MTDAFNKLEKALEEFSDKVEECRNEGKSNMTDLKDAYSGMNRVRERHMRHARYLSPAQNAALSRVFYDDAFIEGMGKVRGIADHVETKETVLRHTDGSAFTITAATSAAVLFAGRLVYLTDKDGVRQRWDHLKNLTEAERRIRKAFARAKESR